MFIRNNVKSNIKRQCFQYLFVPLYFFNVFLFKLVSAVSILLLSQLTLNNSVKQWNKKSIGIPIICILMISHSI